MSVRVRFAPSPTGYLHIGGARTALYSYLFAKANGGKYILRVEDTDEARSKREFEESQIGDLLWLGISHDEGPDKGGDFGPYRQSERKEIYSDIANKLIADGNAYYCFLSSQELEELTAKAESEKKAPHAYHGKYRDTPVDEAKKRIEAGDSYVIRFKNPGKKWSFKDIVRGEVSYPEDMVGDFVIMRSNGMPTYNYCCAIDDYKMEMTHVIRAEEHLNNTIRQLMIYEALEAKPPQFAHVSLLIGKDRQKLSKRHGATSVTQYKEEHYLPEALVNYLCLLGWSHPEEKDIFTAEEILPLFDLSRFSKSSAMYDIQKLDHINGMHMRSLDGSMLVNYLAKGLSESSSFHAQTNEWKTRCCELFKEKIQLPSELEERLKIIFEDVVDGDEQYQEAISWETTPTIKTYLAAELEKVTDPFVSEERVGDWMNHLKKELKIKGKPLFMGSRVVLTGSCHGPDLKTLVSLTPVERLRARVK